MQNGGNFAPAVTPRPLKGSSPRKSRTCQTLNVSPIKLSAAISLSKGAGALDGQYADFVESPQRPSKKKMDAKISHIRNLESHINFGNTGRASVSEIVSIFEGYNIHLSTDEAKVLLCEYEENNEARLGYKEFVESFALQLRSKESGKRQAIKKCQSSKYISIRCRGRNA